MQNETKNETEKELTTIRVDYTYKTKEIAEMLDFEPATIRKYTRALEENGYSFSKSDGGHRIYHENDVQVLRRLKQFIQTSGMSVENSARLLAQDEALRNRNDSITPLKVDGPHEEKAQLPMDKEEFTKIIEAELEKRDLLIEALFQKIQKQEERITVLQKALPEPNKQTLWEKLNPFHKKQG